MNRATILEEKLHQASQCAEAIQGFLSALQHSRGVPVDALLAGSHGQVVAMMAAHMGTHATAVELRRIANEIEAAPCFEDYALAVADPAGSA